MPFPALDEAQALVDTKRTELKKIFDAAGPDRDLSRVGRDLLPAGVKSGDTHAVVGHIRALNDELTAASKEYESLKAVDRAARAANGEPGRREGGDGASQDNPTPGQPKSVGALFVESKAFRNLGGRQNGETSTLDVDMKTLMQTSAGWAPETTRTGPLVELATRPVQVAQMLPQSNTTQNAVTYMEETTFTNNAVEIAEAGTYPEAALALTEQSALVRKIAIFLPVTDEQLQDEGEVRGYIENRLGFMVRQRLDLQILVGNGTPPNLRGLLNIVGIQTQAKAADPTPDAFYKAITKVRVTGQADPNLIVMNPTDWQGIRLLRTADGIYIWGNPSDAGPERMWGMAVAQAQALTAGTGLVADTQFMGLVFRRGLDVQVSNSHGTYFVEGKMAIRADIRVALPVYRPAAICSVTGL